MKKETRQSLELLVEKANKLREFSFENHVAQIGLNFRGTRLENDSWLLEFGIPEIKERDAFLLTFRIFYQENEPISFSNLPKLCADPELSEEYKQRVVMIRQAYLDYVTGHSEYTVELFENHPTRKQMIDVGLYGGLAHTNRPERIEQYRIWARDEIRASLFEQEFTRFLIHILGLIYQLADSTQKELARNAA
jgi:hypothetical protein